MPPAARWPRSRSARRRADGAAAQALAAGRAGRSQPDRAGLSIAGHPACTSPPDAARFSPHGLAAGAPGPDGEIPVAVVGHRVREAIELFALRGAGEAATLRWTGCVPLPENAVGNDVWLDEEAIPLGDELPAGDGRAARALLHDRGGPRPVDGRGAALARFAAGRAIAGTRGAEPERPAADAGGRARSPSPSPAPAASGSGRSRERGAARRRSRRPPRQSGAGARARPLLVAVHTSGLAILRCRFGALPCRSPWKLIEIDPATGDRERALRPRRQPARRRLVGRRGGRPALLRRRLRRSDRAARPRPGG